MSERLLLRLEGGGPPVELPLSGVLSIGSGQRADLLVEGQGVAELHCAVGRIKGGGWALKDLGSRHGTQVNGQAVRNARLKAGDEIALGTRRLLVLDGAARQATPPPPETVPALKGYRIEKRLGRGGMGVVFLAVQESLERRVALKALSPRLSADLAFVRRFQAEARAAAALSHPNVVTVHDVWEEGGHHWLAMEYMERGNLEDRVVREGRLAPGAVLAVLLDAARGLQFAELRGIVHRDIKPANLMQDGLGHTKIADLGLATHLEAEVAAAGDTRVFGTPHFISPEQARGESVDGRSDLYSLGATAYRLLTGRTPFEGATTRDILRGHFTEPVRPPSALAPDVPPALEALVLRLLQKNPADRFPNARALLEELERLHAGLITGAVAGRGPGLRWLLALAAAAAVLVGYFLVGRGPAPARPLDSGPDAQRSPGAHAPPLQRPGGAADGSALLAAEGSPITTGAAPLDDDSALKALEREALEAYAELPSGLLPEERAAHLAELRAAYSGTTAAQRWGAEIAGLEAGLSAATAAGERAARAAQAALEGIHGAGADPQQPLHALLATLRALPLPEASALDPGFLAARAETLRAVLATRAARAEAALAEVDAEAAAGRFESLDRSLEDLAVWLAPEAPEPSPGAQPSAAGGPPGSVEDLPPLPELERLLALHATVLLRRAGLELEQATWNIDREHADARALADRLQARGALDEPLARLELAAVEGGLAQLSASLGATCSAGFANSLRADLARAQTTLAALVEAYQAGSWRRKSILDPRVNGRGTLTVVGADAEGLLIEEDAALVRVPWAAFGADAGALDQLFHQRLVRDYTPEEGRGIAVLMRLAAVRRAANVAREMLARSQAAFTEPEQALLLEGFEQARPWCTEVADLRALDAERAAAHLLAASLTAASQGAWSSAVADAERLLEGHRDTLLVRLLSDGRPWLPVPVTLPPEPPPVEQQAKPEAAAPAPDAAQEGSARDGRAAGAGE